MDRVANDGVRRPGYLPFALMAVLGLALAWLPGETVDLPEYLVAVALTGAVIAARLLPIRGGRYGAVSLSLVYLVSVGVLRESVGGAAGSLGSLMFLPVIWLALSGEVRQLVVVVIAVAIVLVVPLLVIGAPRYPATGWRSVVLMVSLAAMIGFSTQRLVAVLHRLIAESRASDRERAALVARLDAIAHSDDLTGLPNRRSWQRLLEAAAQSEGELGLCVAIIDVDHFKQINDEGGHHAGDSALRRCAAAWSAVLRPTDTLARVGGDEFALLLPGCPPEEAQSIVDRLRAATPPGLTISIGLARGDYGEAAELLQRRADRALYVAKGGGRNQLITV